jgi:Spy/CpxP family protein refolding chaperone
MSTRRLDRWWIVPATALVVAGWGGGAAVQAQQAPAPGGPCQGRGGILTRDDREAIGQVRFNRIKEKLGLSDQQADDIRASLKAMRQDATADFQALCQARLDLRALLQQQDSDPAAVKAAGDRMKALQAKLLDRRLDTYLALRSKLTPDQWAKWVELRKEMGGRFRGRFGPLAL